ncbi:MAG: protease inhibitor I42 family protein [Proteocatella sp.]
MNVNSSEVLIANKTIENLNLINTIKVNGIISTEVYDNPSTGYTWIFEVTGDPGVLKYTFLDKPVSKTPAYNKASEKPLMCGEGTNKILTIKGLKAGKAKLKMSLVRPWEKNIEPAKVMDFEVLVK